MEDKREDSLLARIGAEDKKGMQSTEADSALREEKMLREGTLNRSRYSLLSPKREENKEVQKKSESDDGYVSPFSEEFMKITEERDKEYEEELSKEGAVSSNRIQAFLMLAAAMYFIALIVGYYNTPYNEGVPQVVTGESLDARKYLSESNDYINYVQNAHIQSVEAIENYTADLMSASELASQMKKNNEAIDKKAKELQDMKVPSEYESLHDGIKEMFNAQISMNSAAVNYASHKSEATFVVLDNINKKYENKSEEVLEKYDEGFQQ